MTSPPLLADHTLPDVCHTVSGRAAALAVAGSCLSSRILYGSPPLHALVDVEWRTGHHRSASCAGKDRRLCGGPRLPTSSLRVSADRSSRSRPPRRTISRPSTCQRPFPTPGSVANAVLAAYHARSGWRTHGLPPQSRTVTADTPPSASPRSAVPAGTTSAPAGGTTGETRCLSQALRLQVVAARASRSPSTTRSAARPRAWPSDSPRRRGRVDAWLDQPPHNRLLQPRTFARHGRRDRHRRSG